MASVPAKEKATRNPCLPFVRQESVLECGAACFTMVARRLGEPMTLARARGLVRVGRDGASALDLERAARAIGLNCSAYAVDGGDVAALSLPSVILLEACHWVVVEAIDASGVAIVDPSIGRYKVSHDKWQAGRSIVALEFSRKAPATPRVVALRQRLSLFAVFRSDYCVWWIVGIFWTVALVGVCSSLGGVGDDVVSSGARLWWSAVLLAIAIVARAAGPQWQRRLAASRAAAELVAEARLRGIELGFHNTAAELAVRLRTKVESAQHLPERGMAYGVLGASGVTIIALALVESSPLVRGALAAGVVIACLTTYLAQQACELRGLPYEELKLTLSKFLEDRWIAFTCGVADAHLASLERDIACLLSPPKMSAGLCRRLAADLLALLLATFCTLTWGRSAVEHGLVVHEMTPGVIIAILIATSFAWLEARMRKEGSRARKPSIQVLTAPPSMPMSQTPESDSKQALVLVEDLSYAYAGANAKAVDGVHVLARRGDRIGVVGASGSGKSTLLHLLCGLLEPERGLCSVAGRLSARERRSVIPQQIGVVLQAQTIGNVSFEDSIRFGDPTRGRSAIRDVLDVVGLRDLVGKLGVGLQTPLRDRGRTLSNGELRIVLLARAILGRPDVLLIDDCLGALGKSRERQLVSIAASHAGALIVVSTNEWVLEDCSSVLFMADGRVRRSGPHAELVRESATYAALVRGQTG